MDIQTKLVTHAIRMASVQHHHRPRPRGSYPGTNLVLRYEVKTRP